MDRELEIARIAYNEAIRAISEQERSLESLRGRAATNIAIVALAISLTGTEIITTVIPSLVTYLLLAVISIVVLSSVSLSVLVLRSGYGWTFNQSPGHILRDYSESNSDMPLSQVLRNLSCFLEESIDENESRLRNLMRKMNAAFSLTVLQVILSVVFIAVMHWSITMSSSTEQQPTPKPQPSQPAPTQSPGNQPTSPTNPARRIERQDDNSTERKLIE